MAEANIDGEKRVKCPYCAELILPDAKICRFCGSNLTHKKPGLLKALLLNLVMPGLGAYKCGYKLRGALTSLVLITCLCFWGLNVTQKMQTEMPKLINTSNAAKIEKQLNRLLKESTNDAWFYIFCWGYAFSFIDVIYISRLNKALNAQKE